MNASYPRERLREIAKRANRLCVLGTFDRQWRQFEMTPQELGWLKKSVEQAFEMHRAKYQKSISPETLFRLVYEDQFEQDALAKEWAAMNDEEATS